MKNLKFELISYAEAFVSFVLSKIPEIKEIILFGSVARGEAGKESDIDLFFNVGGKRDEEKIEKITKYELGRFYKSKIAETWFLRGIKNEININVGRLEEWKLKRSIISDGIVLFGKYKEEPKGMKSYAYFEIEAIKDIAKRNKIIRKLFGRKEKRYFKEGMIEGFGGKKLSKSSFVVDLRHGNEVLKILQEEKVKFSFFELWTDAFVTGEK